MVLHRRIEDFLHRRGHPVDLVDEQHVPRFEVGEDGGEVARLVEDGPRGGAEVHPKLTRHDLGEGGLAEAGRTEQEDVIEGFGAGAGGVDIDLEVGLQRRLTDEFRQGLWAQGRGPRPRRARLRRRRGGSPPDLL